ncbi:MAG TPA: hypothetical protein VMU50_14220 [Polyangia bacterium]|nr:hypothetical protein [Polyangia bacterium]
MNCRLVCRSLLAGAGAGLLFSACVEHTLAPPAPVIDRSETRVTVTGTQKLDIVFMIDNSDSMEEEQGNLIRNFPRFMTALQATTRDVPLDVHIGVISSDLGAGQEEIVGCHPGGDGGVFQHKALGQHGTCTAVPRGTYIAASPAGNNFDGPIEDVFSCIAELGRGGCGFEHQLASLRRALGGDPSAQMPPENAGFLRPDARLGIVLITDEDDCSAPPDSDLFTGAGDKLTDRYGPLESFRCNEFGHLCGGSPPPRQPGVALTDCQSNETATSKLISVASFSAFLNQLRPRAGDLVVAAITGPATPYETRLSAPNDLSGAGERYVQMKPACQSANGTADPAVRLGQFTKTFGDRGLMRSICVDDFGDIMNEIAQNLTRPGTSCVSRRLVDDDPVTPGLQADCAVTVRSVSGEPGNLTTVVPSCDRNGHRTPCWSVQADPVRCPAPESPQSLAVSIDWGGPVPASQISVETSCAVCARAGDPGCGP